MFTSEEHAQRSRLFRQITTGMMAVATTVLVAVMFVQPGQFTRALAALAAVNALGLVCLPSIAEVTREPQASRLLQGSWRW